MHGIVHKTLAEYVTENAGDDAWKTIVERANIEQTLYLPVSSYDDGEIDAVLTVLADLAVQNRRQIERDFGRALAPELLSTFGAHVHREAELVDLLTDLESIVADVEQATGRDSLPDLSGRLVEDTDTNTNTVIVTYRSDREYGELARGILEGVVDASETEGTVTKEGCTDEGDDACTFHVTVERV